MRNLRDIKGLKFPDEFVVRHFFKRNLAARTGRVLELGSGTGNNLSLYSSSSRWSNWLVKPAE